MTKRQRKPKLNPEQRDALRTWLAAEYSGPLIRKWFEDRGWEPLTDGTLSYHRDQLGPEIEAAKQERRTSAINSGLALKEERIKRLVEHADEIEAIKWAPDKNGRLWNEAAWRETLDDIAKEMGHRRQDSTNLNVTITAEELAGMSDDELSELERKLTHTR